MSNREKFLDNLNFEEKVKIATKKKNFAFVRFMYNLK